MAKNSPIPKHNTPEYDPALFNVSVKTPTSDRSTVLVGNPARAVKDPFAEQVGRPSSKEAGMETLEGQLPINEYPVTDDEEIVPKGIDVGNAAFKRGNVAGDASNHSSTRMSIPKGTLVWNDPKQTYASMGEGTQWNDDEDGMSSQGHDDINNDYDPNMSGPKPTQQLEDWRAGMLSPWQENDDYRDYTFKTDNVVESRLLAQSSQLRVTYKAPGNVNDYSDIEDNDYDDNGGWATAIPQDGGPSNDGLDPRGVHPEDQEPQDAFGSGPSDIAGIALYPIVRRL